MTQLSTLADGRSMDRRAHVDTSEVRLTVEQQPPSVAVACRRPTVTSYLKLVLARPSLVLAVLNAQLRLRHARRVPLSVRLRGRAFVGGGGEINLGERVRIYASTVPVELWSWPNGRLAIGEATSINYGTSISAHESVTIGRDCFIGQYVIINDNDYHDIKDKRVLPPSQPVVIEDRVWLGARVIVLRGVRIGHDSVISAGSVVTRDIPPRSVAVGHPARVVNRF